MKEIETIGGVRSKGLLVACNLNPFRVARNAVRQPHSPTPFGLIHLKDDRGLAGRMASGGVDQYKIGPHVRDADRFTVEDQPHFHLG